MIVITFIIFKKSSRLHSFWWNSEAVRHPHPIPHLAHSLPHRVRVDLAHPDTAIQLESIPPLLQVHRARDGGAIVGDVSLQCTVEEEVIILT